MQRIIVVEEFEHQDGLYRIQYATQDFDERSRGGMPLIISEVFLRPYGSRFSQLIWAWVMQPTIDNLFGPAELLHESPLSQQLTIESGELQSHLDTATEQLAYCLNTTIADEITKQRDDSPAILIALGIFAYILMLK